jgi:cell division septation protein DedD
VAALTPGVYPLLINRSANRMIVPQEEPLPQLPAPTSSARLSTRYPVGSAVAPETEHLSQQPPSAEHNQLRAVTDLSDRAARLTPNRQESPLPSAPVTPSMRAPQIAAAPPAIGRALPAAKPRVTERDGFFVELPAPNGEAEARSTLRALKSAYAVLKGYELEVRRKDEGERGVIYTVQVGPFGSQNDADQLCEQLKTAGGICFVTRH